MSFPHGALGWSAVSDCGTFCEVGCNPRNIGQLFSGRSLLINKKKKTVTTGLNKIFEPKIVIIFIPNIWVLKRNVSLRWFFCVPTTYVLVEK